MNKNKKWFQKEKKKEAPYLVRYVLLALAIHTVFKNPEWI